MTCLSSDNIQKKKISDIDIACNAILEIIVKNYPASTTMLEIVKNLKKLEIGISEPVQVESLLEYIENDQKLICKDSQYVCCATMTQYNVNCEKNAKENISNILKTTQNWEELSILPYFQ